MDNYWQDLDTLNSPIAEHNCFISVCFNESSGNPTFYTLNLPVYPEDVTNSFKTSYQNTSIIGRPGQIANYESTSDVSTSFNLKLHRELPTFNNIKMNKPGEDIDRIVALIQAADYPKLGNGTQVPITCYKFGDTILIGKQTSANVKWWGTLIDGAYMACDISISIDNVPKKILTFDNVRLANPRGVGLFTDGDYKYSSFPSSISSIWN